MADLSLAISFS